MMRHDMQGLLRVLGLSVVLAIVPAVVTGIVGSLLVGGVISVGAYGLFSNGTAPDMMLIVTTGMCLVVVFLAMAVVVSAASAFAVVMQARAVGYWTRQFDVPAWRGQDDPMPFLGVAAHGHGNLARLWMEQHLHRGVKPIHIHM